MDTLDGSPAVYPVNRDVRHGTIVTQSRSGGDQYQMFFKHFPGTVVLTRDEAYEAARRAGVDLGRAAETFPHHPPVSTAQHAFRLVELTEQKCEEWRDEPGVGVHFMDTHIGVADLMEMQVNGVNVACVMIRSPSENTRTLDILVREMARGKGYGKEIMLHTCKELFSLDMIQMLQFDVVARGAKRIALSKIVNHCVAQIDGATGGSFREQDTWTIIRAGVDLGRTSGSPRYPSRPLQRPRAQRDKRVAPWSAREDEGGVTAKKTRTTSIPREASDAMDRVFHHQVFARLLPPPEHTRVWCTVADDDVDAYVEGTVTRDDAGKLLDGQLDPYCEFPRRGGGEPWRGYVSRMDLIFATRTR